jgi:predicted SAM-dependent methyltransferase
LSTDTTFSDWDWEDTRRLDDTIGEIHDGLARCEKLEPTPIAEPYTREQLAEGGITGIEFAAWKSAHPAGIASDIIPLRSPEVSSERGRLYRVDGERYFVELDVAEGLPFEAGSLDWVYAEHMIEHLTVPVAVGWLREVRRVLAPGGLLRLTTPDLGTYVDGYLGSGFFKTHRHEVYAAGLGPPMPQRRAFMFNQIFYLYGHRWIYDLDELRYVLTAAGFDTATVRQRAFRDGARADVADLDRAVRRDETVYVEVTA